MIGTNNQYILACKTYDNGRHGLKMVKFSLDLVNQSTSATQVSRTAIPTTIVTEDKTLQVVGAELSAVYTPDVTATLANMTAADVNQYFFYNKSDNRLQSQDIPAVDYLGPGYGIAALTWVYPNNALLQANKSSSIIFGFWDRIPLRWYRHEICLEIFLNTCPPRQLYNKYEMICSFLRAGDILHTGGSQKNQRDLLVPRSGTCGGQFKRI